MADKEKEKAFERALEVLEKKNIRSARSIDSVETVSTGIQVLDTAIRKENGGWPRGRIVEIFGPESGGKSTLSLISIASIQRGGGKSVYIDAENAFDPSWAQQLGVNVDDLALFQPGDAEECFEIVETLSRSNAVDFIVIDSTAALVPRAELEGEIGDQQIGLQARIISKALRRSCSMVAQSKVVVVFINQLRDNIGTMWGNPETTPGGRALKFYASLRIRVSRIKSDIEKTMGYRVRATVQKNKIAPPFGQVEFDMYYESGVDAGSSLFDLAISKGIITKDGRTYTFNGTEIVGQNNMKEEIKKNKKLQAKISEKLNAG